VADEGLFRDTDDLGPADSREGPHRFVEFWPKDPDGAAAEPHVSRGDIVAMEHLEEVVRYLEESGYAAAHGPPNQGCLPRSLMKLTMTRGTMPHATRPRVRYSVYRVGVLELWVGRPDGSWLPVAGTKITAAMLAAAWVAGDAAHVL
jgi:hypothetical protein